LGDIVDATLGEQLEYEGPGALLVAFAEALHLNGSPLCQEFAEMVRADMSAEPYEVCPVRAATDLLLEPMTRAEQTAAQILIAAAKHAREARLDDASLQRLMSLATVYVARFESYLAERSVPDGA
jgi:hypothetical protein